MQPTASICVLLIPHVRYLDRFILDGALKHPGFQAIKHRVKVFPALLVLVSTWRYRLIIRNESNPLDSHKSKISNLPQPLSNGFGIILNCSFTTGRKCAVNENYDQGLELEMAGKQLEHMKFVLSL